MTHPGKPRDVDLEDWLDGIGFHPANTKAKQVGHQAAREFVANLGVMLHELLPAGRDKAMTFTALEDVLMRANRALALGGGPADQSDEFIAVLAAQVAASPIGLPRDHRYEAEQRGDAASKPAFRDVTGTPSEWRTVADLDTITVHAKPGSVVLLGDTEGPFQAPEDVEELSSALLAARNQAWPPA